MVSHYVILYDVLLCYIITIGYVIFAYILLYYAIQGSNEKGKGAKDKEAAKETCELSTTSYYY